MDKRLEREKRVVKIMIQKYCSDQHQSKDLCENCNELLDYSYSRLLACPFAEDKPVCSKCTIHCYNKNYKNQIIDVMRYSGPKMIYKYPVDTILYFWDKLKHRNHMPK